MRTHFRGVIALLLSAVLVLSALPVSAAEPAAPDITLRSDHLAFMNGYGNGYFGPNDTLTRAHVFVILYNLLEDQSRGGGAFDYTDVTGSNWYTEPVAVLASRGLLDGQGGALRPKEEMTRGELVALLVKITGVDEDAACSFSDVPETDPIYPVVATAAEKGWINGFGDGTFRPEAGLTRAQAAAIFNRMLGRSADPAYLSDPARLRRFFDVKRTSWYYETVMEATMTHDGVVGEDGNETWENVAELYSVVFYYGATTALEVPAGTSLTPDQVPKQAPDGRQVNHWLSLTDNSILDPCAQPVTGHTFCLALFDIPMKSEHIQYVIPFDSGNFEPELEVTRGQAAYLLFSLLRYEQPGGLPSEFTDVPEGEWYAKAIRTMASQGLLTAGGEFRPDDLISRAELAEMLYRLSGYRHSGREFDDVAADHPHYKAIQNAVARGWMEDRNGKFDPGSGVSRALIVTVLNRVAGRTGDKTSIDQMDERFLFPDVPADHWAFYDIMEASVTHRFTYSESGGERWSVYSRAHEDIGVWQHSPQVVNAATITNTITPDYQGNWSYEYNYDYSGGLKEAFVNSQGYSSATPYLLWISRQNQKVMLFTGSQGNWKHVRTFVCGTGRMSAQTPIMVTYTTYHETGWYHDTYECYPITGFCPGRGFAFHSRLHAPGSAGYADDTIGCPVSMGCIRMFDEDARYIYNELPLHTTVVVY